jgi:hypothetical protein
MNGALRIIALLFLGAVVGLPLGIYLAQYKFINQEKAIGMVNEEAFFDSYAKKEFIYANPQNAQAALAYAVKVHKEMQGKSTLSGWREKADLAWCYADLSLIEESAGNANLASDYMSQAQQILKGLGMKDPSESHIRELLQRRPFSNPSSEVRSR